MVLIYQLLGVQMNIIDKILIYLDVVRALHSIRMQTIEDIDLTLTPLFYFFDHLMLKRQLLIIFILAFPETHLLQKLNLIVNFSEHF